MNIQEFFQNPVYLSITAVVTILILTLFLTRAPKKSSKTSTIYYFIPGSILIIIGVLLPKFVNSTTQIQCTWYNLICHSTQLVKGLFVGLIINTLMILLLIFGVILLIKGAYKVMKR